MTRTDDFAGDNVALAASIDALLDLEDAGALTPHPLGGACSHAYRLLAAARQRLGTPGEGLHPETAAMVDDFASALKSKLAAAEQKYGYSNNWRTDDWEADCQRDLARHVQKGDPLDVSAYAAFCWARGYRTAPVEGLTGGEGRSDVQCDCVGSHGPNPDCGKCSGSGCYTAAAPKATATASVREGFVAVPVRSREEWRAWVQEGERCISRDTAYRIDRIAHMLAVLQQIGAIADPDSGTADTHAGSGEVEKLKEALKPFAEIAHGEVYERFKADAFSTFRISNNDGSRHLTFINAECFDAARAALHPVDSRAQGGEKA